MVRPADVSWAVATKAFADAGGIEPQFRQPDVARHFLISMGFASANVFANEEAGAVATNVHLAKLAGHPEWSAVAAIGSVSLRANLTTSLAIALLRTIGGHESVGTARTSPLVFRMCEPSAARRFLAHV